MDDAIQPIEITTESRLVPIWRHDPDFPSDAGMDQAIREMMRAVTDRLDEAMLVGGMSNAMPSGSGYTLDQIHPAALTLAMMDRLIADLEYTDPRTLVVHRLDVRGFRRQIKRLGWTLEPARKHGSHAYWLRQRRPRSRILVYASDFTERGQCVVMDPMPELPLRMEPPRIDHLTPGVGSFSTPGLWPQPTRTPLRRQAKLRDVLESVTASALAEVDERVSRL